MKSKLEFYGWLLFFLCGVLWLIPAMASNDWIGILVGVSWLIGCLLFIKANRDH